MAGKRLGQSARFCKAGARESLKFKIQNPEKLQNPNPRYHAAQSGTRFLTTGASQIPFRVSSGAFALEAFHGTRYLSPMPIYEFHCGKCGAESEILVRSKTSKGVKCPKCGSGKLSKKFSVFASSTAGGAPEAPSCTGNRGSCGMCGTGRAHSH
jgi:putative FmdB family regulatory protein